MDDYLQIIMIYIFKYINRNISHTSIINARVIIYVLKYALFICAANRVLRCGSDVIITKPCDIISAIMKSEVNNINVIQFYNMLSLVCVTEKSGSIAFTFCE